MSTVPTRPTARVALVGEDVRVPLVTGGDARYVNLDYAASAPALEVVAEAVQDLLPWYSSVHRGAGYKSRVSTFIYEGAREALRVFFDARADDAIVFTRNTTDALNLLSHSLPPETRVVAFAGEHHANMLPWRRHAVRYLPVPAGSAEALQALEDELKTMRGMQPILVTVTGASNVTGEVWPVEGIATLVHHYGGRLALDAAQLAPHHPISISRTGVDFLAMSGHKLYAPFGAGALVGRADWLSQGDPFLAGGGAVDFVTLERVRWTNLPDRQEAGSPNVVGAAALGVACQTLAAAGMDRLAAAESDLQVYARARLHAIRGIETYTAWPVDQPRVGIIPFNLDGYHHALVAEVLSAEYGIGVRHGCFCAHPLIMHLLHVDEATAERMMRGINCMTGKPGALRASFGIGSTRADVDALADALEHVAADGPRATYRRDPCGDIYEPDPDTRVWPRLPFALSPH